MNAVKNAANPYCPERSIFHIFLSQKAFEEEFEINHLGGVLVWEVKLEPWKRYGECILLLRWDHSNYRAPQVERLVPPKDLDE